MRSAPTVVQQRPRHTRSGARVEAEAKLLRRTGARSDGSSCTDGLNPVVFFIDRIEEASLDAIERIEEDG